jgi:myo-inositol-hexaphosphate 3-phosphohydrolase
MSVIRCICLASSGCGRWLAAVAITWLSLQNVGVRADETASFEPAVRFANPESRDQDDACIWIHPAHPAESVVIASDKSAGRLFVYDLQGALLQSLPAVKPGNVDVRQGVTLGRTAMDVVVVNQRAEGFKLLIDRIDPQSRKLVRLDDGSCTTGPNYGGCLYHSDKTRRLFFICTSESGKVEQYELKGKDGGGMQATNVRTLSIGKCEGAVADDQAASLYIAEEAKGVWKFNAEPDGPEAGLLIAKVGEHGLRGDVEGLALLRNTSGMGILLVSDQGRSRFMAYRGDSPHAYLGEFAVAGAVATDGVAACAANLGPSYPGGIFVCHTDRRPRPLLLTPWPQIDAYLKQNVGAE